MRSVTRSRSVTVEKAGTNAANSGLPPRRRIGRTVTALAICAFLFAGCAGLERDETADWTPEEHYAEAKAALADGLYEQAIKYYEKLESRYPYGKYAQQAQIEIAYAYYKSADPANAIAACDRFIKLHPNHPNVDYAYYLKGLVNFNEDIGFLGHVSNQDLTERDPKGMRESFDTFRTLINRYPNSIYAEDAHYRLAYLINAMAGNELHVARYYFKRGAYLAAANRAQQAIRAYPEAPAVEQALEMLIVSYEKLGMADLRGDALKVLALNYPENALAKPKAESTSQ